MPAFGPTGGSDLHVHKAEASRAQGCRRGPPAARNVFRRSRAAQRATPPAGFLHPVPGCT